MKYARGFSRRDALRALPAVAFLGQAGTGAWAQEVFPARPVKLIVGYPPAGSVDQMGRILAEGLAQKLGPGAVVTVENVSGAAGAVAAARLAATPADGYTLMLGSSNEMIGTGVINRDQKYDARRDFAALGLVASAPTILVAGPKSGVKSLDEFVDLSRRNPGKFSYGSSGVGSTLHFAGELIKQKAGLFITHIPYRGVAPLASDLVGGTIEFAIMSPTAAAPFIQSGKLMGLAVTSSSRLPAFPGIPALGEHPRLQGYELIGWAGLVAPKGLPADVQEKLRVALAATMADPQIRRRMEQGGAEPATGRENFAQMLDVETTKYLQLAQFASMR